MTTKTKTKIQKEKSIDEEFTPEEKVLLLRAARSTWETVAHDVMALGPCDASDAAECIVDYMDMYGRIDRALLSRFLNCSWPSKWLFKNRSHWY